MYDVVHQRTDEHELPIVTEIPLAQLASADDTVLANALRRYLREAESPLESISAFGSYVT